MGEQEGMIEALGQNLTDTYRQTVIMRVTTARVVYSFGIFFAYIVWSSQG